MDQMGQPNRKLMQVLSKGLRAHILALLAERDASTREMATEIGENLAVINYHVRVLERCGTIGVDGDAASRSSVEDVYRLRL